MRRLDASSAFRCRCRRSGPGFIASRLESLPCKTTRLHRLRVARSDESRLAPSADDYRVLFLRYEQGLKQQLVRACRPVRNEPQSRTITESLREPCATTMDQLFLSRNRNASLISRFRGGDEKEEHTARSGWRLSFMSV